jgi:hypothetical protein
MSGVLGKIELFYRWLSAVIPTLVYSTPGGTQ